MTAMRIVIDTNSLETIELRTFLRLNPNNIAVLMEHTCAEIFKQESIEALSASFSVLSEFPSQVQVLWGNRECARMNYKGGAIASRLIDRKVTAEFPNFLIALKSARAGHLGYLEQIAQRRIWALERSDAIMAAFGDRAESLAAIRGIIKGPELRWIRTGDLSEKAIANIFTMTSMVAFDLAAAFSPKITLPKNNRIMSHFIWRYALCHLIQLAELSSLGGRKRAVNRARNDHFDNVFATFSTYYNGLMTNDVQAALTHTKAREILSSLNVPMPLNYHTDRCLPPRFRRPA